LIRIIFQEPEMSRSPSFDRAAVVSKAMHVFWRRGYGQTTVSDLVAATGLQPGSLYAAFGNKKGVFLEVLDCYNRDFLERIRQLGADGRPVLPSLRAMLESMVEDTLAGRNRQGCLAVNALLEMAAHEPDVARQLERNNARVREAFTQLLERARADGEIPADRSTESLAAFLVNNLWGMRVTCRSCTDADTLRAVVDGMMGALTARS
jgi:TetR/AcrR family transcriptional regulator, transcriptional repressor for nem operon